MDMAMESSEEIIELIDSYLDGTAETLDVERLKAWLDADQANISLFARQVFFHQQLREFLVADSVSQSGAGAGSLPAPIEANPMVLGQQQPPIGGGGGLWTRLPLLFVLMLLLAAASVAGFQWGRRSAATNSIA